MASPAWLAEGPAEAGLDPDAVALADLAVSALIDEATLSPKPGLVDGRGNGAHADLTLDLMRISARGPAWRCASGWARWAARPRPR